MPAVTLRQSTAQRSQNCGVLMARSAVTFPVVTIARGGGAVQPLGFHPGRGIRTVNTPNIMKQKYRMPIVTNVDATPGALSVLKRAMSIVDNGDAIIAPPPKPMIAMPVAIPGRSGNHLMSEIGRASCRER